MEELICPAIGCDLPASHTLHQLGDGTVLGLVTRTETRAKKVSRETTVTDPNTGGMKGQMRQFDSGATRDSDADKLDFEGFLSPQVLWAFAEYMHKHRVQSDGSIRGSDNWQEGIPLDAYMKSLVRHLIDLWMMHRGHEVVRPENGEQVTLADTLGAILFNVQGYWLETLRAGNR